MAETFALDADIQQMMSLISDSFHANQEIFLRELISNSSNALEKMRQESVTDPAKIEAQPDLYIKVTSDRANSTITIEDSGIGMTKSELVENLGTVAKSSTKALINKAMAGAEGEEADAAGMRHVGVGFFSACLVSSKVKVISKSNDDEQHIWESLPGGSFTVQKDTEFVHGEVKRGTKVICYLKEQSELLEERRLKDLVSKHSESMSCEINVCVAEMPSKMKEASGAEAEDEVMEAKEDEMGVTEHEVREAQEHELPEAKYDEVAEPNHDEVAEAKADEVLEAKADDVREGEEDDAREGKAEQLREATDDSVSVSIDDQVRKVTDDQERDSVDDQAHVVKEDKVAEARDDLVDIAKDNLVRVAQEYEEPETKKEQLTGAIGEDEVNKANEDVAGEASGNGEAEAEVDAKAEIRLEKEAVSMKAAVEGPQKEGDRLNGADEGWRSVQASWESLAQTSWANNLAATLNTESMPSSYRPSTDLNEPKVTSVPSSQLPDHRPVEAAAPYDQRMPSAYWADEEGRGRQARRHTDAEVSEGEEEMLREGSSRGRRPARRPQPVWKPVLTVPQGPVLRTAIRASSRSRSTTPESRSRANSIPQWQPVLTVPQGPLLRTAVRAASSRSRSAASSRRTTPNCTPFGSRANTPQRSRARSPMRPRTRDNRPDDSSERASSSSLRGQRHHSPARSASAESRRSCRSCSSRISELSRPHTPVQRYPSTDEMEERRVKLGREALLARLRANQVSYKKALMQPEPVAHAGTQPLTIPQDPVLMTALRSCHYTSRTCGASSSPCRHTSSANRETLIVEVNGVKQSIPVEDKEEWIRQAPNMEERAQRAKAVALAQFDASQLRRQRGGGDKENRAPAQAANKLQQPEEQQKNHQNQVQPGGFAASKRKPQAAAAKVDLAKERVRPAAKLGAPQRAAALQGPIAAGRQGTASRR